MNALRPRDFVECDGLLAAVTSVVHPEGPTVTPRYLRLGDGLRKLDAVQGRAWVVARHPDWLVDSSLLGVEVVLVPVGAIERVHRPESRLAALLASAGPHPFERRAAAVARALMEQGVSAARLGVTGSLLVGAATTASDMDLVAYGRAAFAAARSALAALQAAGRWHGLEEADWRVAWERRGAPGDFATYVWHEARKGTKALADGVRVDLSLLQDAHEGMAERPPYRKLGRCDIEATVRDASAGFDYPARFGVAHPELEEVVSYTATYAGQAEAGEHILASGWLEEDREGRRRLLVGTSREAVGEWLMVQRGTA